MTVELWSSTDQFFSKLFASNIFRNYFRSTFIMLTILLQGQCNKNQNTYDYTECVYLSFYWKKQNNKNLLILSVKSIAVLVWLLEILTNTNPEGDQNIFYLIYAEVFFSLELQCLT